MTNNSCSFYFQHCMVKLLAVVFKNNAGQHRQAVFALRGSNGINRSYKGFLSVFWVERIIGFGVYFRLSAQLFSNYLFLPLNQLFLFVTELFFGLVSVFYLVIYFVFFSFLLIIYPLLF